MSFKWQYLSLCCKNIHCVRQQSTVSVIMTWNDEVKGIWQLSFFSFLVGDSGSVDFNTKCMSDSYYDQNQAEIKLFTAMNVIYINWKLICIIVINNKTKIMYKRWKTKRSIIFHNNFVFILPGHVRMLFRFKFLYGDICSWYRF